MFQIRATVCVGAELALSSPPHPPAIPEEPQHGKPAMSLHQVREFNNKSQGSGFPAPATPARPEQVRPFLADTAKTRLLYLTQPLCPSSSSVFSSWQLPRPCWRFPLPCRLGPGRHSGGSRRTLTPPRPPCCPRESDGVRASGEGPFLLHPPPPAAPEAALDGRDAGNAGTAKDSSARGPSARPLARLEHLSGPKPRAIPHPVLIFPAWKRVSALECSRDATNTKS